MTIAETFVDWSWQLTLDKVPPTVQRTAALHLLDGLGNALAGRRYHAADYAIAVGRSLGGDPVASMLGEAPSVGSPSAALANGILLHCLDFDDTHADALLHATAVTLPPALAVGEEYHVSGRHFLEAAIASYELVNRLGMASPHGFHERGFHATSVCGNFSAAMLASRLMGRPASDAVAALGIAGSQASGTMEYLATGSTTKQLHPGWASLAGIVAARLAAAGASGPNTIIEGERGLYALYADVSPDLAGITEGLGERWETTKSSIKPYPACYLLRPTLDAAASLFGNVSPSAIEEIQLGFPAQSIPIVCEPVGPKIAPRTTYEAKFSAQWSTAAMIVDGSVDVDTFDPDQLARPDLMRLAERTHCYTVPSADAMANTPADITIRLGDGSTLHATSEVDPDQISGLSEDAILTKFMANVGGDKGAAKDLLDGFLHVAELDDVTDITALAAGVAASWGHDS